MPIQHVCLQYVVFIFPEHPCALSIVIHYEIYFITEEERRQLHDRFVLDKDQPVFRQALATQFPGDATSGGYLTNTHVGLNPSGGEQFTHVASI